MRSHARQTRAPRALAGPALRGLLAAAALAVGCDAASSATPTDAVTTADAGADSAPKGIDPFVDRVVSFKPGAAAGYGQNAMPGVVYGPPHGAGDQAGSLDVVSLGQDGEIVVAFDDLMAVDGPGPDFIVFENPFAGFIERGVVSVSSDGVQWYTFPCQPGANSPGKAPPAAAERCAGTHPVYSSPANQIPATDPLVSGGDAFDLAELGVQSARYVRIRDTGTNEYLAPTGGFDLDAVAVVHAAPVTATGLP